MSAGTETAANDFRRDFALMRSEIAKVIVGQQEVVDGVLTCLLADGHVLLEGVPGLGKTLLIRTLARVLDLRFSRIQFTPDLMPADIIGTNLVVEDAEGQKYFEFQPGPIFANIILADEINRATPKTQSAMLEVMQEHSVTVGGVTHAVWEPYIVLATQNPLEMEGTYPLPEAQLDRFMFKIQVEYPSREDLVDIMTRTTGVEVATLSKVTDDKRLVAMRELVRSVPVARHVLDYAVRIVLASHPDQELAPLGVRQYVSWGSSPRGAQALILGAKVQALMSSRFNVAYEDVQHVARAALRHRMILNFEGEAAEVKTDDLIEEILGSVPTTAPEGMEMDLPETAPAGG
jgi:MoxR-like ATPase